MTTISIYKNIYIEIALNNQSSSENSLLTIELYDKETDKSYFSAISKGDISESGINLKKAHKIIINALNNQPKYSIDFYLEDYNFILKYDHEIFSIYQVIMLGIVPNGSLKNRYSLYLLQKENQKLKDEITKMKETYLSREEVNAEIYSNLNRMRNELMFAQGNPNRRETSIPPNNFYPNTENSTDIPYLYQNNPNEGGIFNEDNTNFLPRRRGFMRGNYPIYPFFPIGHNPKVTIINNF